MMPIPDLLPDSRPYPDEPVKNELLLHASAIAANRSRAQNKLSGDALRNLIVQMLQSHRLTALSVALNMAPDAGSCRVLWQAMEEALQAQTEDETGWVALPVILVAGCNQAVQLPADLHADTLNAKLAEFKPTSELAQTRWLPQLVGAAQISRIKPGQWFAAKQNPAAAEEFAAGLALLPAISIPAGQSVQVVYALGYGRTPAACALKQAALPLMQYWQQQLAVPGVTLFTNPLDAAAPLAAIRNGNHMRQRMALDVFSANAIRTIRLQNSHAGVVIAAETGGRIAFGFSAATDNNGLAMQVFRWQLSPTDSINTVVQNFLDLMSECRIEHIRLLHDVLPEDTDIPGYAQSLRLSGHNPLFVPPTH